MNSGWKLFLANKGAVAGAIMLIIIALAGLFGEMLYPVSAMDIVAAPLEAPSLSLPMGADYLGRDVLAGILHGAGTTLIISLAATLTTVVLGLFLIGAVAGFFGGRIDNMLMRLTEFFQVLPPILLAMVLVAVFGPGLNNAIIAIGITLLPGSQRVVRATTLSERARVYVDAAQVIGASGARIAFRHIAPNTLAPVLVLGSAYLGAAILLEATLGFLGLGAQPPTVSWGSMLSGVGLRFLESYPWLALFPGLAISLTVLALSLLGDVMRDVRDPRLRI